MDSFIARPTVRWLAMAVLTAVVVIALPSIGGPGFLTVVVALLITAQLVLGVDLVFSSIRQMSLVHAALMGISAYLVLVLQGKWHWSFWAAFGGAFVACLVAAAIISTFVFRVTGYYFAILTFVISQLIVLSFSNLTSITGGSSGYFLFTQTRFLGMNLGTVSGIFRLAAIATFLLFLYGWAVRRSVLGAKASAIGDNEPLAKAVGMPTTEVKQLMFIASAVPVGIAGALDGTALGAIQPSLFGATLGIAVVLMALLGGSGYIVGPLIGAAIYIGLPEVIPLNSEAAVGVLGALFILLIRISPNGLSAGLVWLFRYALRRWRGAPGTKVEPGSSPDSGSEVTATARGSER
jgi:branched-chain amino acid transport system permease protein